MPQLIWRIIYRRWSSGGPYKRPHSTNKINNIIKKGVLKMRSYITIHLTDETKFEQYTGEFSDAQYSSVTLSTLPYSDIKLFFHEFDNGAENARQLIKSLEKVVEDLEQDD